MDEGRRAEAILSVHSLVLVLYSSLMTLTRLIVYTFFCATVAFSNAYGQESRQLRFVYTEYYPANFRTDAGDHSGFFVDIIREALEKRMGVSVAMEVFPWKRCQSMVESGEADMIATIPTDERLSYSVPVNQPIWIKKYRVYTYRNHPAMERIRRLYGIADLRREGFSVLSYLGNSWSETALKGTGIPVVNANSVESMYRMLVAKRADILVEDPLLAAPMIRSLSLEDALVLTEGIAEETSFHLLIGKKSSFVPLVDRIDRTLKAMLSDGSLASMLDRYR